MSAIERAARAVNLSLHLDRRQIAEAVITSLRADLASCDPERVREVAEALGLEFYAPRPAGRKAPDA